MTFNNGLTQSQKVTHTKGGLLLARVVKVYPLDMCVDVVLLNRSELTSAPFRLGGEGQFDYRIPVMQDMGGAVPTKNWFSEDTEWGKKVNYPLEGYGSIILPQEGDYVIVGFLNEDIHKPVVLGSINPIWRKLNTTGETETPEDTEGPSINLVSNEGGRYCKVFPSMVWWKINSRGEVEISLPFGKGSDDLGGTFIKIGQGDVLTNLQDLSGNSKQLKEMAKSIKDVIDAIKDNPEAMDIISGLSTTSTDAEIEEACKDLRAITDIKIVLDGDPRPDEEASDCCGGGCCCGSSCAAAACDSSTYDAEAHTNSNCTCGATWDYIDSTYVSSYNVQTCGGS